ncbi:MAG: guanylate kinase [Nitratireductor sp.]
MSDGIERRGIMLVLSSPSGAGKSTIARNLLDNVSQPFHVGLGHHQAQTRQRNRWCPLSFHFHPGIRAAARSPDALLEWAEVHGNSMHHRAIRWKRQWRTAVTCCSTSAGRVACNWREKARGDVVSVFILPPSMAELKARLNRRAEDLPEVIDKRLANALIEIPHWRDYDYVVINDDLNFGPFIRSRRSWQPSDCAVTAARAFSILKRS